eukprot:4474537-Pleurochrysis_carterae.AAC.1
MRASPTRISAASSPVFILKRQRSAARVPMLNSPDTADAHARERLKRRRSQRGSTCWTTPGEMGREKQ